MSKRDLTVTSIIAASSELLENSGYRRIDESQLETWQAPSSRLYEDEYGIVGVVTYETAKALKDNWKEAHVALTELLTESLSKADDKSWEGYLVLLTPGIAGTAEQPEVDSIRYNLQRVRKLVATGQELRTIADIRRILLPLLPLRTARQDKHRVSVLHRLPELLHDHQISLKVARTLTEAYRKHENLMEALAGTLSETE